MLKYMVADTQVGTAVSQIRLKSLFGKITVPILVISVLTLQSTLHRALAVSYSPGRVATLISDT